MYIAHKSKTTSVRFSASITYTAKASVIINMYLEDGAEVSKCL